MTKPTYEDVSALVEDMRDTDPDIIADSDIRLVLTLAVLAGVITSNQEFELSP